MRSSSSKRHYCFTSPLSYWAFLLFLFFWELELKIFAVFVSSCLNEENNACPFFPCFDSWGDILGLVSCIVRQNWPLFYHARIFRDDETQRFFCFFVKHNPANGSIPTLQNQRAICFLVSVQEVLFLLRHAERWTIFLSEIASKWTKTGPKLTTGSVYLFSEPNRMPHRTIC